VLLFVLADAVYEVCRGLSRGSPAVALGVAVVLSARSWALRLPGAAWGPLVILAVLATGNHFALDVAAGLALTGAGLLVALRLTPRAAPAT
jgi:membrane-associated phospholipid phosphatase